MVLEYKFDYKHFLKNVTTLPGVYRMFSQNGKVLYIGKAKNLKKRVSSYFRDSGLSVKNKSLMKQVFDIKVIATATETEALILENNLIKKDLPKYNILLRDDKSYPYICLTNENFPRLRFHRGKKKVKEKYFGPYPSVVSVKSTLDIMQKVFLIRNCNNSFFKNRSRACLQHQVKRCSAPCVNLVNQQQYSEQINDAVEFLEGSSNKLVENMQQKMLSASKTQDFETALIYRDKIQSLRKILEKQYITNKTGDADVIVLNKDKLNCIILVFFYRDGRSLGSQYYSPKVMQNHTKKEILQSFLEQFYFDRKPAKEIILNKELENKNLLINFFKSKFETTVNIINKPRKHRAKWLEMAEKNAALELNLRNISKETIKNQFKSLVKELSLKFTPKILACTDISHTMGEETVGSYVVFDENGAKKSNYRKYNITGITPGDDYGAMEQLLTRRFKRFLAQSKKNITEESVETMPDVLFIDGGKGQFNIAKKVLRKLKVNITIVAVTKDENRKSGQEKLIVCDKVLDLKACDRNIKLKENNPAQHLIEQLRDESHRFAIIGHRKKRDKKRQTSELNQIDGIGNKRRQALLKYFAGIKGIKLASVDDISKVEGISKNLAQNIYNYFHE